MPINTTNTIALKYLQTPLGEMVACATEKGICMFQFSDRDTLSKELLQISKHFNAEIVEQDNKHFSHLENELSLYFKDQLKSFTVPLDPVGTDFQKQVWDLLLTIPFGKTLSYQEQANLLGNPNAVRAVAKANGVNKIAVVIPCHRVIGSNGKLTGYSGGIDRKLKLLQLENQILF